MADIGAGVAMRMLQAQLTGAGTGAGSSSRHERHRGHGAGAPVNDSPCTAGAAVARHGIQLHAEPRRLYPRRLELPAAAASRERRWQQQIASAPSAVTTEESSSSMTTAEARRRPRSAGACAGSVGIVSAFAAPTQATTSEVHRTMEYAVLSCRLRGRWAGRRSWALLG